MAPLEDPPQNQFFERLNLRRQCFLISAVDILETDKYFDIVEGAALRGPPKSRPPENQFFDWLKLGK